MKPRLWELKKLAHDLAAEIWGDMNSEFGNVGAMYQWMQAHTRTGHIRTLTEGELEALIKQLKSMVRRRH